MVKKILYIIAVIFIVSSAVYADKYVPEFNKMQTLRCDYSESIYDNQNVLVSKSNQFRIYRLDDENDKIYLQKEPIGKNVIYGKNEIKFDFQSMTDEYIMMSKIKIDRQTQEYYSKSTIIYDNPVYDKRYSESIGTCKVIK